MKFHCEFSKALNILPEKIVWSGWFFSEWIFEKKSGMINQEKRYISHFVA